MDWIRTEQADDLSTRDVRKLYRRHINQSLPKFFGMLGFSRLKPQSARGLKIQTEAGVIHDFTGGLSVLNYGHNHPVMAEARLTTELGSSTMPHKEFADKFEREIVAHLGLGEEYGCLLLNSGAEANEAGLQLALLAAPPGKNKILCSNVAYHGKTSLNLAVSGSEDSVRKYFLLPEHVVELDLNDEQCLEKFAGRDDIAVFIIETRLCESFKDYSAILKKVERLCTERGILLMFDEIYLAFGRSARNFSFQEYGLRPDLFTVSKTFGGGVATVSALFYKRECLRAVSGPVPPFFNKVVYRDDVRVSLRSSRFLVENKMAQVSDGSGRYFLQRLDAIRARYPNRIDDIQGTGLAIKVQFKNPFKLLTDVISWMFKDVGDIFDGSIIGFVISQLFDRYRILTFAGQHNKQCLIVNPSLVVSREEIDYFAESLEDLLRRGLVRLVLGYVAMRARQFVEDLRPGRKDAVH